MAKKTKINTISLSLYRITIKDVATRTRKKLGELPKNCSLYLFAKTHTISRSKESYINDDDEHNSYHIDKDTLKSDDEAHTIYGLINAGESGVHAVGKINGQLAYTRTKDVAEEIPLYFMMYLPPDSDVGFVIFQSFKGRRIKTTFASDFEAEFEKLYEGLKCDIVATVPDFLLKRNTHQAHAKEIILTGEYHPQSDIEALQAENGNKKTMPPLKAKFSFSPLSGKQNYFDATAADLLGKISKKKKELKKDAIAEFTKLLAIENDDKLDVSNAKLRVIVNGKTRMISFGTDNKIAPDYDITGDVTLNEQGHPLLESVHGHAIILLDDMKKAYHGK